MQFDSLVENCFIVTDPYGEVTRYPCGDRGLYVREAATTCRDKRKNNYIELANGYCSAGEDATKVVEVAKGYCSEVGEDATTKEFIKVGEGIFPR